MHEDNLQIGDILFFMNTLGVPEHVAVYAGKRAGTHFITHAVSEPYFSIMTTRLKPEIKPYRVFRCKDTALALQLALRMRIWSQHQIPFSVEKHELHLNLMDLPKLSHPKTGGKEQARVAQENFASHFYRYIEYAAHPDMPEFPHEHQALEGMYCSEAITAALNLETLKLLGAVKSVEELQTFWVSDRIEKQYLNHWTKNAQGSKKPSKEYLCYHEKLQSQKEYPFGILPFNETAKDGACLPSIAAWRYDLYGPIEEFIKNYAQKFVLPFDSKITTPFAMLAYFEAKPTYWKDCGELKPEKKDYPLEKLELEKKAWQKYVDDLFQDAKVKQQDIRSTFALQLSAPILTLEKPSPDKKKRRFSVGDLSSSFADTLDLTAEKEKYRKTMIHTSPQKPKALGKIPLESLKPQKLDFDSVQEDPFLNPQNPYGSFKL